MKKVLSSTLAAVALVLSMLALNMFVFAGKFTYADTSAEVPYASLYVNDLGGLMTNGATVDPTTGNITAVNAYGRFGYQGAYENVEVTSVINFSAVGNTTFILRAQNTTIMPAGDPSYTNKGYYVRWYAHGQFDFVANDTVIMSAVWGPLPAMAADTDYIVVFKAVNTEDGNVHVTFSINGAIVVDYLDETVKCGGGIFGICSEGSTFSARGDGFKQPAINLADASSPITSSNFPATINEDGSVSTGAGNSGVGYIFQATDTYTFKTKVTPSAAAGSFSFTVGAYKTNAHEMNRPDVVDSDWGWSEPGYTLVWSSNGQRHLNRGGTLLEYVWHLPTFTAGQTYEIEYGITQFGDGSNRIHLRIDGNIVVNYFDRAREGYTPLVMNPVGGQPASLCYTALVLSSGVESTITPYEMVEVQEKTIASKDLNAPVTIGGAGTFDRNGAIAHFGSGVVAGYPAELQSGAIKFKANFSTVGSNLILSMRSQGTFDTPWGGGWSNKGYSAYLYPNGQTILAKNGQTLFEGWATGGFGLAANTDYTIEMGTVDIVDGAVKVYVKVNDVLIMNYIDTVNAIADKGWFTIYSGGFEGKMSLVGYDIPTVTSNAEDNAIKANQNVTLSYAMNNKDDADEVTYYIDEANSTTQAAIQGDNLIATSAGKVEVYVLVNGMYSENLALTVVDALKAELINLPTAPIIVGGESVTVDGKLTDDSVAIESKVFSIENVTGKATIDASSGKITAVAAGTVRVFVTINDVKSDGYILSISPKIEIGRSEAMAVGERRNLSYSANCELPDEQIMTTYELVEGDEYVTLNTQTGEIKAEKIGLIRIRVTVTGETFQAVSALVSIPIEAPVVVLKDVKDMYVGQTITLCPAINSGVEVESQEIVVVSGSSHVTIDGNSINAKSKGTVKVKAVINGVESDVYEIVISDLTPTLIAPKFLPKGDSVTLDTMFNFEEFVPTKVVYSIVSGGQYATLEGSVLTASQTLGKVKIKVEVYDLNDLAQEYIRWTFEETIELCDKVRLAGLPEAADDGVTQVLNGSEINLSFVYTGDDEITSVQFVLVSGNATLTQLSLEAGQTPKDTQALLKLNGTGDVKLKVVVNGVDSPIITITVVNPRMSQLTKYIIGIVVVGVVFVACVVTLVTLLVLKKKKNKSKENK